MSAPEFKIGSVVKIVDVDADHPAHIDEESQERPNKTGIKNLKRFVGLVGTVDNSWYTGGFEACRVYVVKFAGGVEEWFSGSEFELTEEPLSTEVPGEIRLVEVYEPLNDTEKEFARGLFTQMIGSVKSVEELDRFIARRKHYIEESVDMALFMTKQFKLSWHRGEREVTDES